MINIHQMVIIAYIGGTKCVGTGFDKTLKSRDGSAPKSNYTADHE